MAMMVFVMVSFSPFLESFDQDAPTVTADGAAACTLGRPHPVGSRAAMPRPRTIVASSFFMMTSEQTSLQSACRAGGQLDGR